MRACCKETVAKVAEDEPVFTLRGQDKLAAMAVKAWILAAEEAGVSADKLTRARAHLTDIETFQREHPGRVKLPD
jgi:hypothetical protein